MLLWVFVIVDAIRNAPFFRPPWRLLHRCLRRPQTSKQVISPVSFSQIPSMFNVYIFSLGLSRRWGRPYYDQIADRRVLFEGTILRDSSARPHCPQPCPSTCRCTRSPIIIAPRRKCKVPRGTTLAPSLIGVSRRPPGCLSCR